VLQAELIANEYFHANKSIENVPIPIEIEYNYPETK